MKETSPRERLEHISETVEEWEDKRESMIPEDKSTAKKATGMILRDIRAIVEDDYHKLFFEEEE